MKNLFFCGRIIGKTGKNWEKLSKAEENGEKKSTLRFFCATNINRSNIMEAMYMKDFFEWLGVNEKVAKVVIWIFVIMVMIISTNMLFESIGLPYYKITYDNLVTGTYSRLWSVLLNILVCFLNFYSIMLLVFRIKEWKGLIKYAIPYVILNFIITEALGYVFAQAFILIYLLMTCYLYSGKNWKYTLYGFISLVINTGVQILWYWYKASNIAYEAIDGITRFALTIDYFIIMGVMIVVKEIYLKKRRDEKCGEEAQLAGSGLEHLTKKESLQKESQKRSHQTQNSTD